MRAHLLILLVVPLAGCATASTEPPVSAPAGATIAPAPLYRNTEFGIPADAGPDDDIILEKNGFTLSYDCADGRANWVSWHVNGGHFGDSETGTTFRIDTTIPDDCPRVSHNDYTNSGFQRGHLVRQEERSHSAEASRETYLASNAVPQHAALNAGPWLELEDYVCYLTRNEGNDAYLVAGPHGAMRDDGRVLRLGNDDEIVVPTHTWKAVLVLSGGHGIGEVDSVGDVDAIAVIMPNRTDIRQHSWQDYRVTIDEIEQATGYDLFADLPDSIEEMIEGRLRPESNSPHCTF